jgi:hypothetical protein
MALNSKFYFLSPVEVAKVTPKNLEEVAEWCGGKVAKVESRKVKGRIDSYVWVPTPKGAPISWAFPGMFITKRLAVTEKNEIKATYSVFRKDYFAKNYFSEIVDAVDQTWERQARENMKASREARTITIVVDETADPLEVAKQLEGVLDGSYTAIPVPATEAALIIEMTRDLPDSLIEQRVQAHEDAVEAEVESA